MNFTDTGIILDARAHGETHAIADVFTENHGRWAGLVYGGQGRQKRPLLQPGNEVTLEWKGRGDDSLGHFTLEMAHARAGEAMGERLSLSALSAACAVALATLPEREPHARAYAAMSVLLGNLDHIELWPALMARWELGLLAELGFGLTLDRCASTGARENLIYVSPRSACAVSAEAGEPYKDKMLPLPPFLRGASSEATLEQAIDALTTTGHFLETRILHISDKQLPEARMRVVELLRTKL
ncbi:DNA repair protein RecO [Hyphococcus sp.]|uniref:DNA repair protein RecO n=1 Tax=Hyphococcus sp. TaxID=2038636 RepID=UPI00207E7BFE|nr:MAG: DNA repair protein RecO [Marinicaulis sp.]